MSAARLTITHAQIHDAALSLAGAVHRFMGRDYDAHGAVRLYGVPRGGIPAAYALASVLHGVVVSSPIEADLIVDDFIDSGATMHKYQLLFPNKPFAALFLRNGPTPAVAMYGTKITTNEWLDFPWEADASGFRNKEDIVVRMMQAIGEDPTREGLRETPSRVIKAWGEWFAGYGTDPSRHLKTFEDGSEDVDTMVVMPPIPIFSHCEHHVTPFFGHAIIGYIPDGKIVGLSKFSRVANDFARRLQVQERLTTQIANCIQKTLSPLGVGVYIECQHLCMCSRGIKGPLGKGTKTHAVRGCFTNPDVKAEFLSFCKE